MKEKIFYFSWAFVRAVNKNYYTKVEFGNYTNDLFYFAKIMFLTYKRNPFNENEPFTSEILRPYNENEIERWGMFERIIFMQEFNKISAFVKTLPNYGFDFYVELLRKIKSGNDNGVVNWLTTEFINFADMWETTEHQKELMRRYKFIDVTWEWTTEVIEFLEDEKTFGEHHWEYGKVIEILNRPRYKEKVYDALDKALQIEQLENRQDLVDHLRTFSDIAETHFNKAKYKKWVIYPNNVKWMESWAQEVETTNKVYSTILLRLFHNNIYLIDEIVGSSDDEIAKKIKQWAKERDKFGKPLIENPENNLRTAFAKALKTNNLIKCSIDIFRRKLS